MINTDYSQRYKYIAAHRKTTEIYSYFQYHETDLRSTSDTHG